MVPRKFNIVDFGDFDLAGQYGEALPGIYDKIVDAHWNCVYIMCFGLKFGGFEIAPQYMIPEMFSDHIMLNGIISIDQNDVITIPSIEPPAPQPAILPGIFEENGTFNPPTGVDGYAPVTVNVSEDDPFALKNYIESSGTQYIDTGYIVKDNSLFEAVALVSNPNIQWATLFGTRVAYDNNACLYGVYGNNRPGIVVCWGGSQAETTSAGITAIIGTKAVYTMFKLNFGLCNQEYTIGGEPAGGRTISNTYSIYLFALNTAGASEALTIAKLYRFRIYESDILVHEFIPWQENGVACMKDTVTSEIKYNAGTGDFVYGTDV